MGLTRACFVSQRCARQCCRQLGTAATRVSLPLSALPLISPLNSMLYKGFSLVATKPPLLRSACLLQGARNSAGSGFRSKRSAGSAGCCSCWPSWWRCLRAVHCSASTCSKSHRSRDSSGFRICWFLHAVGAVSKAQKCCWRQAGHPHLLSPLHKPRPVMVS